MVECLFSITPVPCQDRRVIEEKHSNRGRSMAHIEREV